MEERIISFISLTVIFILFIAVFIRYLRWVKENQIS